MGLYDFWWNSVQSGQISELEKEVEALTEKVNTLKEWIDYLHSEIKILKGSTKNE